MGGRTPEGPTIVADDPNELLGCFPKRQPNYTKLNIEEQAKRRTIEEYGQASRTISTGSLKPSRALHSRPINPVVFRGPLGGIRHGNPYLGAGFAIRCFHRLSLPHTATQLCPWQDNWHTGGASSQVLSYCGQLPSRFLRAW